MHGFWYSIPGTRTHGSAGVQKNRFRTHQRRELRQVDPNGNDTANPTVSRSGLDVDPRRTPLVGFLYLAGGALRTELHRVDLGMGVRSSHRRLGGGGLLLEAAIRWAELQPNISGIDLGVFSDNHTARALYARAGFVERSHTPDRFRVDGHSLDDVSMTRHVS